MTRQERSEYTYIKNTLKRNGNLGYGCTLTIRTDASSEYKQKLNELYTSLGFHPASVRVDKNFYDDKERVIFIFGLTFDLHGEEHSWTELYTKEEKDLFAAKLA